MSSRARSTGVMFAVLLLCSTSGCSAGVSVGTPPTSPTQAASRPRGAVQARAAAVTGQVQRPGSCRIAPPQVHVPTGEWTATETILDTSSVDACAGERLVRPWDFRRLCDVGHCETYLYTVGYYGVDVAEVVPKGRGRYVATFRAESVPCPHRPGEDAGRNLSYGTITLWWSPHKRTLQGLGRDYQTGACGGGPPDTSRYVAERTNPTANPPAEGP